MGREGTENLQAADPPSRPPGPRHPFRGAWPVLPRVCAAASEFTPSPLHAWWWWLGGGNCLAQDLCPMPPSANRTSRSTASAQGCLRLGLPRQQGWSCSGAWPVSGELSDWSSSSLMVTALSLGRRQALMDCLPPLVPEYLDGTALSHLCRQRAGHSWQGMYKPVTDLDSRLYSLTSTLPHPCFDLCIQPFPFPSRLQHFRTSPGLPGLGGHAC